MFLFPAEDRFVWVVWFFVAMTPGSSSVQGDSHGSFSRSGRRLKPPLHYWCGEREVIDRTLNVTIEGGGTNYLLVGLSYVLLLEGCFMVV